jgi:hypothetical protein
MEDNWGRRCKCKTPAKMGLKWENRIPAADGKHFKPFPPFEKPKTFKGSHYVLL